MSKKVKMIISAYIIMTIGLAIWTLMVSSKIKVIILIIVEERLWNIIDKHGIKNDKEKG